MTMPDSDADQAIRERHVGPVTAVVTRDVVPGREAEYEEWVRRAIGTSARHGAYGHTMLTVDPAASTRRVLIAQFPDQASVREWDESSERARLVEEAARFSTADIRRASGLEAWFTLPGQRAIVPPPRWKQLLVSLLGAYPLVVIASALLLPRIADWPLLVRSAVLPIVLLTLMTYVVMPFLTPRFRLWLFPRQS